VPGHGIPNGRKISYIHFVKSGSLRAAHCTSWVKLSDNRRKHVVEATARLQRSSIKSYE
jgi:hypothetical protein